MQGAFFFGIICFTLMLPFWAGTVCAVYGDARRERRAMVRAIRASRNV